MDAVAKIEAVMAFDMTPVLERYRRDHDVSARVALEQERELKRYFLLAALKPERKHGMRGSLDALWHTFLLFTREYMRFSEVLLGKGRFLHHVPELPGAPKDPTSYQATLDDYAEVFGEEPPVEYWPRPSRDASEGGRWCADCSSCNECSGCSAPHCHWGCTGCTGCGTSCEPE